MSGVMLAIVLHGAVQFLIPMPDRNTCFANQDALVAIVAPDSGARIECFDMAHQGVFLRQVPARPEGEKLD
jgi:hypothetical protein